MADLGSGCKFGGLGSRVEDLAPTIWSFEVGSGSFLLVNHNPGNLQMNDVQSHAKAKTHG